MDKAKAYRILQEAGEDPNEVYNSYKSQVPQEPSLGRKAADAIAGFGTSALQAMTYTGRAGAAGLGYLAKGVEKGITPIVEGLGGTVAKSNVPLPSVQDSSYFKQLGEDAGVNKTQAGRVGSVVGDIAGSMIMPLPASPVAAAIAGGAAYNAGRAEEKDIPIEAAKGAATGAIIGSAAKALTGVGSYAINKARGATAIDSAAADKVTNSFLDEVSNSASPSTFKNAVDTTKGLVKKAGQSAERDALYASVKPEIVQGKLHVSSPDSVDVIGGVIKGFEKSDDPLAIAYRNSPDGSVQQIDKVVQFLNQKITPAMKAGAMDDVRILTTAKKDLTSTLDKQFPGYAKARNLASEIAEEVKQLKSTPLGKIATTKEGDYSSILPKLFKKNDLQTGVFQRTRDMINEADPELYSQLVRQGLQKELGNATNTGSSIYDLFNKTQGGSRNFQQLWSEALNTPQLQTTRAKFEVVNQILKESKNPGFIDKLSDRVKGIVIDMSKKDIKETTLKVMKFLNTTAQDSSFEKIVKNSGGDMSKLVPQVLELMQQSPVRKAVSVGATQAVNQQVQKRKGK